MKKVVLTLLALAVTANTYASETEIWAHIGWLQDQVALIKQQLVDIPAGPPGPQGPKGERGPAGIYQAGDGIVIEGSVISAPISKHHIGELYQGGIIFWVDETGQHGLIASRHDLNHNQGIQWRNGESGNKVTNARADGIGAGDINTRLIIAEQTIDNQAGNFAALVASRFSMAEDGKTPCTTPAAPETVCYGGWYLPSIYELSLLKANLQTPMLMAFAPDYYWSSTEANVTNAWLQNFSTGELLQSDKANTLGHVRAVRQF